MAQLQLLVFGSNNNHKKDEIAQLLSALPFELRTAGSFGKFTPDETASTLEGNALIKAQAALALTGLPSFADDTGLEVDALDGRPGIYAARYAGEGCSFADNIAKLLTEMRDIPESRRTATFSCAIAYCCHDAKPQIFTGHCTGRILFKPVGTGGFGYDPIFFADEAGKALAELTIEEKNRISHRSKAVRTFMNHLITQLH